VNITVLTDDPARLYAMEIGRADSLQKLLTVLRRYKRTANDAYKVASSMTPDDFLRWRDG
jgi:tryptophan 2,3-dioxygenase